MSGIIDYIRWRGDLGFTESAFNEVDNLIISKLSYMNFVEILNEKKEATINELANKYLSSRNNENIGLLLKGEFYLMLELMAKSKRFGQLKIKNCIEIIDENIEIQFSAMTIEINKNCAYIAFRGTDDTLIGWKEDFQMSFLDVVPAQKEALIYLNNIEKEYKYTKLYIGGHSKGGNLAVYSAVYSMEKIKKKIVAVYNNDGPGFKKKLIDTKQYKDIADRIITFIPQSSVVGMLLEHEESYQVVKSNQKGVLQHDGFSWEVMGTNFEYLTKVADDCKMVDLTVKKVLNTMSLQQREEFTNVIFEIISVNENRTLADIKKEGLKSLYTMSKNYNRLDKNLKRVIAKTMYLFFGEGFRSFLEVKNSKQCNLKLSIWKKTVFERLSKNPIDQNKKHIFHT